MTLGNVEVTAIETSLAAGTSVLTQTVAIGADDGNITLAANVNATVLVDQDVTWTLQAHGKIDLGSKTISITPFVGKTSSLVLDTATLAGAAADHSITGTGAITVTNLMTNAAIAGGSVSLTGKVAVTNLNFNSNGAVTINDSANDIFNIATVASTAGGAVTIVSTEITTIGAGGIDAGAGSVSITATGVLSDVVVSGAISGTGVTLTAGRSVGGTGAVSGGTGAVSVKASGNLGINLNGVVTGTSLTVEANSGPVTVNNADNVFTSFNATGAIGDTVTVVHKGGLTINALDAGANAASFTTNTAGNITLAGDVTAGDLVLNAAGTLAINAKITVAGGAVGLSGTSITQTAAGVITADTLGVTSAGTVDLSAATSSVATFTGNVGSVAFLESNGFSIGESGVLVGLTATGTVQLSAGGTITQDKAITAPSLAVRTTAGNVNLTGADNDIGTFAASAAGFVALLEANDVQIGSVAAVGALAALDGITATNGVSIRTLAGSVTQAAAGVITAGAGGLAVSVTGGNIALDTATNATSLVAFAGADTVAYKTSSNLDVGEVAQLGNNAKVTGAVATTSLALATTGAATVITQSELIDTPTLTLATGANGQITLTNGGNLIDSVQSSGTWGTGAHSISDSDGGLNVGPITSNGNVSLATSGGDLVVTGAISVGANTLALAADGDNAITATAAAITAGTLTLQTGAGGSASIQTAAHNIGTIATAGGGVGTGGIVFKQSRAGGTTVGPITSAGSVVITDGLGEVTVSGAITVTNADLTLVASSSKLNVNAKIDVGSGEVALEAQGDITQADSNAGITANGLRAQSSTKSVTLAPANTGAADVNNVSVFAGEAVNGSVSFRNAATFTIGKVNNISGINAGSSVTLQVNAAGGTINQAADADGAIVTPILNLTTNGGDVTIDSASNDIAALGTVNLGSGALTVSTAQASGFDVGTVTANGGIDITNTAGDLTTSAAITSDGDISLRSTTGKLTLGGAVTSNNNGVTLRSSDALNTGASLVSAPTAVTGDVTLISDTSTVTIGAGGVTVGDTLTIQIGAGLTLNVSGAITAASVALHADIIEISAAINATDTITLAPVTVGTATRVGGAAGAGFVIDSTELTFLTSASTLTIGQQSTGTTTSGAITVAAGTVGNATLNLFSTAGVSQTGVLTVDGGTGALSITAAGTVALGAFGGGVAVGTVSGSTTSGDFLFIQGGTGALTVGDITTAGGEIIVRNFNHDLTVTGNLSSGGGFIAVGANIGTSSILTINGSIDAGAGTVFLFSRDGTTQGGASVITATNLQSQNFSTNDISLTGQNVVSGNVRLDNAGGAVSFTNTVDYALGGISAFNSAVGVFTASSFGVRTAGASSATLTTGGNVTQGALSTDAVSAGTLIISKLGAANPTVTLDNASNTITNLGAVTLGTGSLTLVDGTLGLTINGNVGVDSLTVTTSGGSLSQAGGTTITANSVTANATGGGFIGVFLNSATNDFSAISGSTDGFFGFAATTTTSLTANAITAAFGISLTTTGGTSDLSVNGLLSASAGRVTLTSDRDISQTVTGGIAASQLQVNATSGAVDLTTGAANNSVSSIAGQSNGDFAYTDGGGSALTIGTLATAGIASTTGSILVNVTKAGATLTVSSAVTASAAGESVTLNSTGDLTFTAALTANAGSGRVSLTSTAGSIIQGSAGGVISGAEFLANAATNVDLSTGGHSVGASGFAATAATGYVAFLNNTGLEIDSVGGTNGVTAGGAIFIGVSSGDLTQTATGIITAGAGLALFASTGSIVFDQQNLITGNVAVVSSPNANVTIRNKGDLNIGLVGPLAVVSGSFSANGIAASTAAGKFVSLISDTGVITQDAGAGSRILGNELRITTAGKDATLTNTSNSIVAVGNSNLGAGRLTVFDGVGDLTLSNPVVADGGVILTTQTTFNLPGTITVANGDISLTSVLGSISLTSTLSAVNGQVQLDATAAGQTITQAGAGTITAKTLIARAGGNVTLDGANNDVGTGTIAGSSSTGTFTYVDKTAVTIGSLTDSTGVVVNGITTTNQDITIVAGAGGATGGIAVDQAVNAGTAIVRLQTSKGDISQAAAGLITANSLLANAAAGSVNLAAVANNVVFVAGKSGGSFRLQTNNATGIFDVAADAGALTTAASGITSNGDMAILTNGNMVIFSPLNAGAGTMRLATTGAGQVFQTATGTITADALLIDATNTVTLTNSVNNDVNTIAGRTTLGAFRYQDKDGFTVGTVSADGAGLGPVLPIGPLTGVTTAGGDITLAAGGLLTISEAINAGFGGGTIRLQTGAGDLTQGINGTITGGSLLAVSTGGMVNLTGATNTVTGIAGSAFTSFLFQNSVGYAVSNVTFASDGIVAAATGITANSGGGGTAFVVDLAVASGTLAINGPVSSANGMIVYRRTPTGTAGAIDVGGAAGNLGNDISSAKLVIIDHTGASPIALYGATPGVAAGGLFSVPTPGTGFSPLPAPGSLSGGTSTIGELNGLNSTVYFFASAANIQSAGGGGSTFGLLGIYGQSNTVNLTTSVRTVDPNLVRSVTDPFSEPLTAGPLAAFFVRHDGLATATEQFNSCPIGTINCVVFTTPIAAPSVSTDDVVIGVGGAPLDDSSIFIINQGNEDLIFESDDEGEDEKRKGRKPQ
ncbi:MAG: S-layer family protein [Alphaproteobacteria bacterium]|nr:S-layer family protein [Alphaproteobacteria bacterium]